MQLFTPKKAVLSACWLVKWDVMFKHLGSGAHYSLRRVPHSSVHSGSQASAGNVNDPDPGDLSSMALIWILHGDLQTSRLDDDDVYYDKPGVAVAVCAAFR